MQGPDLHVVLIDPALLDPLPDAAILLPPGLLPLAGGWPLRPVSMPEPAAAALQLGQRRGGAPALLWPADGDPGWLARALNRAGWQRIMLHRVDALDPTAVETALRRAGLAVTAAAGPIAAPTTNRSLAQALPLLLARADAAGQPVESRHLRDLALQVSAELPQPWPTAPEELAAAIWSRLPHEQGLLPAQPAPHDPLTDGPAGLTGKRVTLVIEKLAERSGGAERVLIETANALAHRGHEVEILSHEFRGRPPFYPTAPGVRLANLRPPRESRSRLRRLLDRLRGLAERVLPEVFPFDRLVWQSRNRGFHHRLSRHLAATRPDVALAFMPPAISALALAAPGMPLRRIASTHNAPEQDFCNPERWDPSRLDRRRRLALTGRMDRIAVLLPEYRDWYPAALRQRIAVIPNAVPPQDPARLARAERGNIVLAVGRLAAVKRHDLLIAAWARIAPGFPGWQLHIYGEGPERGTLQVQITAAGLQDSVQLRGHSARIADAYLGAALLAHPAAYEGFPLAVTEALAAGLPVLGFADCSGLNRLVQDGLNGHLIPAPPREIDPVRRIEPLSAALATLMADAATRQRLGAAGPASMAPYTPASVIAQWEALLFDTHPHGTETADG